MEQNTDNEKIDFAGTTGDKEFYLVCKSLAQDIETTLKKEPAALLKELEAAEASQNYADAVLIVFSVTAHIKTQTEQDGTKIIHPVEFAVCSYAVSVLKDNAKSLLFKTENYKGVYMELYNANKAFESLNYDLCKQANISMFRPTAESTERYRNEVVPYLAAAKQRIEKAYQALRTVRRFLNLDELTGGYPTSHFDILIQYEQLRAQAVDILKKKVNTKTTRKREKPTPMPPTFAEIKSLSPPKISYIYDRYSNLVEDARDEMLARLDGEGYTVKLDNTEVRITADDCVLALWAVASLLSEDSQKNGRIRTEDGVRIHDNTGYTNGTDDNPTILQTYDAITERAYGVKGRSATPYRQKVEAILNYFGEKRHFVTVDGVGEPLFQVRKYWYDPADPYKKETLLIALHPFFGHTNEDGSNFIQIYSNLAQRAKDSGRIVTTAFVWLAMFVRHQWKYTTVTLYVDGQIGTTYNGGKSFPPLWDVLHFSPSERMSRREQKAIDAAETCKAVGVIRDYEPLYTETGKKKLIGVKLVCVGNELITREPQKPTRRKPKKQD